jgi:uncharacterized membrane protein
MKPDFPFPAASPIPDTATQQFAEPSGQLDAAFQRSNMNQKHTHTGVTAHQDTSLTENATGGRNPAPRVNVGQRERAGSLAGGVAMAVLGFKVRGLTGLGMIGAGYLLARRGYSGHCPAYRALNVDTTGKPAEPAEYFEHGIHVEVASTIEKPKAELFAYWRDFSNLPRFMRHLNRVDVLDNKRSHWVAKAPAGSEVEWDAEIINEEPNALIAWRSLGGADVDNAGSVRFLDAAGGHGTEVRVVLDYIPPAGAVGKWVAKLFGEAPDQQIKEDLHRFKQLMETGESSRS